MDVCCSFRSENVKMPVFAAAAAVQAGVRRRRRRTVPGGRYRSGDVTAVLCGLPAPLRDVLEEVPPPPLLCAALLWVIAE